MPVSPRPRIRRCRSNGLPWFPISPASTWLTWWCSSSRILLLTLGVYRFARLWVDPRAASLAALASVFLGAESFLVYSAGQLSTTFAAPLYLNAMPYLYQWARRGGWRSFLKGATLAVAAAAAHHATLIFGSLLFALPVLALAWRDGRRKTNKYRLPASSRERLARCYLWRWASESCFCRSGSR